MENMQDTVNKLYSFTTKMVTSLEHELDQTEMFDSQDAIKMKRVITDNLNKLATLIKQLNKLQNDYLENEERLSPNVQEEDMQILNEFVRKRVSDHISHS